MPRTTAGQRLREVRERAEMSRAQLALASGVSVRTIARAELEGHLPAVARLQALARALDVGIADLLDADSAGAA